MARRTVRTFPAMIWMELATSETFDALVSSPPDILILNSYGGDVQAGLAVHDVMKLFWPETMLICNGLVASAATLIFGAFQTKRRFAFPHTNFLLHPVSLWTYGKLPQVLADVSSAFKLQEDVCRIQLEAGFKKEWVARGAQEETWLTATDLAEAGLLTLIDGNSVSFDAKEQDEPVT